MQNIDRPEEWNTYPPEEVADYIRLYGTSASIAADDETTQIFKTPGIEGIIAYKFFYGTAIILGDPVCPKGETALLAAAFHEECKKNGWRYIYLTVSESFAKCAIQKECRILIEVGYELTLDPSFDTEAGVKGRPVRAKVHHSKNKGTVIEEYKGDDKSIEIEIQKVASSWLKSRKGPQIYLSEVDLFNERIGKRWFYAKNKDTIVGVALLSELTNKNGYVLQFLMPLKTAPHGTSEHLVVSILKTLHKEGYTSLSFGVAQSQAPGEMIGLGFFAKWVTKSIFFFSQRFFHLNNRRAYWTKFQPKHEKSYLLFSHKTISLKDLLSLAHALNVSL